MRSLVHGTRRVVRLPALAAATALAVVAAVLAPAGPASADPAATSWNLVSTVPNGAEPAVPYAFAPPTTDLVLSGSSSKVQVTAVQAGWQATFQASAGDVLTVGRVYPFVVRASAAGADDPGLLVDSSDFACTKLSGSFQISELELDPGTGVPTRLAASLTETCSDTGKQLSGHIHVNSVIPDAHNSYVTIFSAPPSPPMNTDFGIKGTVSDQHGPMAGVDVLVTRREGTEVTSTHLTTDSMGLFVLPQTFGVVDLTYTADYAGDADHAPSSSYVTVRAARETATLTLSAPTAALHGAPISLNGSLTTPDGPVVFAFVTVVRNGGGSLGGVYTDVAGHFTLMDAMGLSDVTYTAEYLGTPRRFGATATAQVAFTKEPSTLELSGPATGKRGQPLTINSLLFLGGAQQVDTAMTLTRSDLAGTTTTPVTTGPLGVLTVTDTPTVGGEVSYTVSWPGTNFWAPAEKTVTVDVARHSTELSIHASASTYGYGADAKVLAHLGTTYNGRYVSLYAQPLGTSATSPGTLIAKGRVNSNGDISAYYPMTRKTTFTAVFAGDYRYLPTTATVTPSVSSRVSLTLSGYAGKSGSYYHYRGINPVAAVGVSPLRTSGCTSLLVQRYTAGAWQTTSTIPCAALDATSHSHATYLSSRTKNVSFRIRAQVGSGTYGAAGTSAWVYFLFV